jgi:hypothetical protein
VHPWPWPARVLGSRETHRYELALEWAFRRPYAALLAEARANGACDARELLALGRRLFLDAGRLYRGEISTICCPARLPRPGEHTAQGGRSAHLASGVPGASPPGRLSRGFA